MNFLFLGIPWGINSLPFTSSPTMIVGIDMFRDNKKNLSIMALTSTWDTKFCNFYSTAVVNGDKHAFCEVLSGEMTNALNEFAIHNKNLYP